MEALATFAALSFTGRSAPESTLPAERGERSGRHERRRDDDGGCCRHERRADESAGVLSLKAQVQAVFTGGASNAGTAGDEADSGGLVDAEFKARLRYEGPQGKVDLKLEIELDDASRETFDAALSSFTETLYAALRSLYGSEPQGTRLPGSPSPASPPPPPPALASPPPSAPPAASVTTPVPTTAAPAPAVPPSESAADPAPQAVTPDAGGATRIDLRLRLRYASFEDSMGGLLQRAAQPGAVEPGMFDDLVQRFGDLQRAANGGNETEGSPFESLGSFLAALAQRYRAPAAAVETQPPAAEATAAPAPAPATLLRFSVFSAEYRAVTVTGDDTSRGTPLALAA